MSEDRSRIDELNKSLYSRNAQEIRAGRKNHFTQKEFEVNTDWEHPEEPLGEIKLTDHYDDNSMSFFTKLLIGSFIFFVIAVGIGAYLLFNGANIVSANNVDIQVTGPISVSGGEPVSLNVQVLNKNNIKLEVVDLSVEFPDGTANPDDVSQELKTFRETIPDIEPGSNDQKVVRAALFGEENSKKTIKVKVEYRVKGSNAIFYKEKDYEVLITSSPLSLSVSSFSEVTSNQEFDLTVTMTSNATEILRSLVLKSIYPFGFTFISSNIKPSGDNATWKMGDIPPGGKRTLTIHGKIEGQDDEARVFRFLAGAASAKNDKVIGTQYITASNEITIKKPFITVNVSLDGDSTIGEHVGQFNTPVQAEVTWFNNLPTAIIDGEIHVKLSGTAFDKAAVVPEQGYYNSATNEIVWNKVTTRELGSIGAGESGRVTFRVTPHDNGTVGKPLANPNLSIQVSVKGNRVSESNVPENITTSASRTVLVASNVSLSEQVVRSTGPFQNTGPIPPKAEQQTTYTVIWTVYNSSSNISNAQVVAVLPPYVKWVNKSSPNTEDIKYNSVNGQITWNIGNVNAYSASGSHKKEVYFQVVLEPSVTQVGQTLSLVNEAVLTATDDFTGLDLKSTQDPATTRFGNDPAFKSGDEMVTQ